MLNIDNALKTIYKNDMFPMVSKNVPKDLELFFAELNRSIGIDQFATDKGDFELTESICSDDQIRFGECNASQVKFTLADVSDDIKGKEFNATQTIIENGSTYTMPFGYFTVESAVKQDDLRFKDVTAYDRMNKIDTDVTAWYNGLFPLGTETYTLAQLRSSFLTYVGLAEDINNLPLLNDSMVVTKTIEPESLKGRMVIEAIEEINGAFGHINRSGQFTHVILKPAYGLYPSKELLPSDTLYLISESDTSYTQLDLIDETITDNMRKTVKFEEYTVKEIDKLIIRTDSEDIGSIVGTGTNAYVIEGNFLVFGKSATELEVIATNAFGYMAKRPYRPYESDNIGLPYIEPGDFIKHEQTDAVTGYVLQRTLKGIQALNDVFTATGNQERTQNTNVNKEIIMLKSKTTKIKKDVDGVRIDVEDLESRTNSKFEQTAQSITAEATRATDAEGVLSGKLEVLAGQVVLKVMSDGRIASVDLDATADTGTSIKFKADDISLEGLITANGNFKILTDGSIETVNGKYSGRIELRLDNNNASIYGSDGASSYELISYYTKTEAGITFKTIVIGDETNIATRVTGPTVSVKGKQSVGIFAYYNGGWRGVSVDGSSIYTPSSDITLGRSGNRFTDAFVEQIHIGGSSTTQISISDRNILPGTYQSVDYSIGSSSYPWDYLYIDRIYHSSSGTLGFFGTTPTTKKSVSQTSSSAALADVITGLNALKTALAGYGLITSS